MSISHITEAQLAAVRNRSPELQGARTAENPPTPASSAQAASAGTDHVSKAVAAQARTYESDDGAIQVRPTLLEQINLQGQTAAQAIFKQQNMREILRNLPIPHTFSVHDTIEEVEMRRKHMEHASFHAEGGIPEHEKRRLEGSARISADNVKTKRLQLLRFAHALSREESKGKTFQRNLLEQQRLLDSLSERNFRRELRLLSLLRHREHIDARALKKLGAAQLDSPEATKARVIAAIGRVLSQPAHSQTYRQLAPHLPHLFHLLGDPRLMNRTFNHLRRHAQSHFEEPANQELLISLADSLSLMNEHPHMKRRQFQALRRTPKASSGLVQALLDHVEDFDDQEIRDAELYHLILAHAHNSEQPAYSFEQKIQTMVDKNSQRKALQALGLADH